MRWTLGILAVGLLANAAPGAPASPSPFMLDDVATIVSLHGAAISPDGKEVAVIVSVPDLKTNKAAQRIDIVDVASGASRSVTSKRTGLSAPSWSPDGRRLAFLADDATAKPDADAAPRPGSKSWRDGSGGSDDRKPQVFVMSLRGGDPERVTDAGNGVDAFAWSPDGEQIAYLTADEAENAKAIREHNDVFEVTDNHFLTRAAQAPTHLWVVPASGGTATRLTSGKFSLNTDAQDSAPRPAWSPDGKQVAFTRFPGPYWGPSFRSVIASVPAAGGAVSTLVGAETSRGAEFANASGALAYLRPRGGDRNNGDTVYLQLPGRDVDLARAIDRNISSFAWLPGGRSLLLAGEDGTHRVLWEQPLEGPAVKLATAGVEVNDSPSVSATGVVAFVGSTSTRPDELYVLDSLRASPRRLTHFNAFTEERALGRTTSLEWRGPNRFTEDGVLTYPVGYEAGRRYPVVLVIHGGPTASSTEHFSALVQLFAAKGFVVFQPNYRGSNNRGDAYQHALYRDTGDGPGRDVLAGLAAVEKLGIVDPARVAVTGWSYGGYMTAWLTSHDRRWKAAVAGAPLTDWVMDYTLAYYQQGDEYFFGGSPWDPKYHDIWRAQSPITHVRNVTAPTLLLGDVGDPNVPLLNAYEWYHALRDNGVEVQFFAYPADTHFPGDIVRTTDVYRRWVDWVVGHLK